MERVILAALVLSACASATAPTAQVELAKPTASHALPEAPPPSQASVEDAALAFVALLERCDRRGAAAAAISYDEIASIATKDIPRDEFEKELSDFIAARCRELAEPHPKFVGATIQEQLHLTPEKSHKVKREVDVAIVQLVTDEDGKKVDRGTPFVFIKTDAGWKFSPKK